MRCFYSSRLGLDLPTEHPFAPEKFSQARQMLIDSRILSGEEIIDVGLTDAQNLRRIHDPAYLSKIYYGQLDIKEQIRLGLPSTTQLYSRNATEVEVTRQACYAALEEGLAVALAGGTHQAFHEHGETFCVFNDVAAAIRDLQQRRPGIRVMVVDTAATAGRGTASLLRDDPRVFTYSIHVGPGSGLTPHPETSSSMDVETVRYVEGEMYLAQLFSSLARALENFAPDLIIWVSGADGHRNDRFGGMMLELKHLQTRDEVLLGAFLRNRIPVALLFGNGSNRQPEATAKIHRNTVATAARLHRQWRGGGL